jgi:hypothetical protein
MDHRPAVTPETAFFWDVANLFLTEPGATIGRLMRFPCLRADGNFFATCDHRTGDLIVKLPRQRVSELIASRAAQPFAPAGRTFKEWASIPHRDADTWRALLAEARAYARGEQSARVL